MSRVGKLPLNIPTDVNVTLNGNNIEVKGKKGTLDFTLPNNINVTNENNVLTFKPKDNSKQARSNWGMSRSIVNSMVKGVVEGFEIKLELSGVGYKSQVSGKNLVLSIGYSHDIKYEIPEGININNESPTLLSITGINKQKVGMVASIIKKFRKYDPYKGKGIYIIYPVPDFRIKKEGKKK